MTMTFDPLTTLNKNKNFYVKHVGVHGIIGATAAWPVGQEQRWPIEPVHITDRAPGHPKRPHIVIITTAHPVFNSVIYRHKEQNLSEYMYPMYTFQYILFII